VLLVLLPACLLARPEKRAEGPHHGIAKRSADSDAMDNNKRMFHDFGANYLKRTWAHGPAFLKRWGQFGPTFMRRSASGGGYDDAIAQALERMDAHELDVLRQLMLEGGAYKPRARQASDNDE